MVPSDEDVHLLEIVSQSRISFEGQEHEDESKAETEKGERHRNEQHLLNSFLDWVLDLHI